MSATGTSARSSPINDSEAVPIVIDLGKEKRGRLKALKRGRGKLAGEIASIVDEVRANLGEAAGGKQLVPLVLIYRRKRRRKNKGLSFPFFLS